MLFSLRKGSAATINRVEKREHLHNTIAIASFQLATYNDINSLANWAGNLPPEPKQCQLQQLSFQETSPEVTSQRIFSLGLLPLPFRYNMHFICSFRANSNNFTFLIFYCDKINVTIQSSTRFLFGWREFWFEEGFGRSESENIVWKI